MPRPQRKLYSGAFYFVSNHIEKRKVLFKEAEDYDKFLDLLKSAHQEFKIKILGYILNKNSYHLLVETPDPNLPQALRLINGVYTQHYNRKYHKSGPLFKGRYKSILIGELSYLAESLKYIHESAGLKKRKFQAKDHLYSSYHAYLKKHLRKPWINCEKILSYFSEDPREAIALWKKFSEEPISEELLHKLNPKKWPSILGSASFLTKIKDRKIKTRMKNKKRNAA